MVANIHIQGCRFVPYRFSETKLQMVPMDLNIGFQGLALIQGQTYNPDIGPGCQKTKPANLSDMILGTLLRESLFFIVHGCLDMFLEAGVMARSIAIGLSPFIGWLADIKGVAWVQFLGAVMLAITGLEML